MAACGVMASKQRSKLFGGVSAASWRHAYRGIRLRWHGASIKGLSVAKHHHAWRNSS